MELQFLTMSIRADYLLSYLNLALAAGRAVRSSAAGHFGLGCSIVSSIVSYSIV